MSSATRSSLKTFAMDDGIVLRADAWGDSNRRPVLLLHGGAQTRNSWKQSAQSLAKLDYYAVSLDLRGHGESDWSGGSPYTFDRYVEDIRQVVAELGQPTILIGASLGGMISMLYAGATAEPEVTAVVLVDIASRAEDAGVNRIKEFLFAYPKGFASLEEAGDAVAVYLSHRKRPAALKGLQKSLRHAEDGRYYWHWDPAFVDSPLISEVRDEKRLLTAAKAIQVPLLLVRGVNSDIVSPEITQHFLEEVPQASYVEVGGAGHTLAGDSNDEFTAAVIDFLKTLS